jgi:serine protease inhibitor
MGMTEIFDDRVANFTNMVTPKLNRQGVYVSDARHKAYIEVNEEYFTISTKQHSKYILGRKI